MLDDVTPRHLALGVLVAIIWGVNFVAIDLGLGDTPPLVLVAFRFLLVAVPPVAIVVALYLVGLSLGDCIQAVLWVGLISLGFWGGVAGRRAGLTGWHLALSVVAGLLVGGIVLGLQVLLKPGTAVPNGVAFG